MRTVLTVFLFAIVTACNFQPEGFTENEITVAFSQIYIPEDSRVYTDFLTQKPANGTYQSSYGDGSQRAEVTFENGYAVDGSIWSENGDIKLTFAKESGQYTQTRYHSNGNRAQKVTFRDGVLGIGNLMSWYEDGNPESEFTPEVIRNWYPGGQLESEVHYKDEELHGRSAMWHENGQLAGEVFYADGVMHGAYVEWNEEGNVVSEKEYERGELISESM
ncbi:MAG: toxin-antitoxin system YwqK family antitoxin [Balneolaceae bacterium]